MPKKRGNGDGGLWERKAVIDNETGTVVKPAQWVGVLDLGWEPAVDKATGQCATNPDGTLKLRRARRYFYGARKTDVAKRLKAAQTKLEEGGGTLPDEKTTTAAYLAYWLESVVPGTVKDSVAAGYAEICRIYITPYVGEHRLVKLTPTLLNDWMRRLENSPIKTKNSRAETLSPRTRKQSRSVFRRALSDAVNLNLIPSNPLDGVKGPKVGRAQVTDVLTGEQARELLTFVSGHRLEAAFRLALSVGLRRGELLGLRWDDADLDAGTLTVRRTLKWNADGPTYDLPKTEAARRVVPLTPETIASLKRHRAAQVGERAARMEAGQPWGDTSLIFVTEEGGPIPPRSFLRYWYRVTVRSGLGRCRLHGARHSSATIMLEAGVPLEVVGQILGHSSYGVTVDSYSHLSVKSLERGSDAIASVLG